MSFLLAETRGQCLACAHTDPNRVLFDGRCVVHAHRHLRETIRWGSPDEAEAASDALGMLNDLLAEAGR